MQPTFALTTRQAIRLVGVEQHVPYSHLRRHGHWGGVIPRKLPNGRLLWPKADVLRLSGLVQVGSEARVDLRPFLASISEAGLPADETATAIGLHLLAHELRPGYGIGHVLDDAVLVEQLVRAWARRVGEVEADMDDAQKRRLDVALRYIVGALETLGIEASSGERHAIV